MIDQDFDFEEWAAELELDFSDVEADDLTSLIGYINDNINYAPFWAGDDPKLVQAAVCEWTRGVAPKLFDLGDSGYVSAEVLPPAIRTAGQLQEWCEKYLEPSKRERVKRKLALLLFRKEIGHG